MESQLVQPPNVQRLRGMFTQNSSENNLRFICIFSAGRHTQHRSSNAEDCANRHGESVLVTLPSQCNVYQLRLHICMMVQEQNYLPDPFAIMDPERYTLLYDKGGDWYEAYDDCQIIKTLDIPWSRDSTGQVSAKIFVKEVLAADSEEEEKQQQLLAHLIGHNLAKEACDRLGELSFTRRKLASPRREAIKSRDDKLYATEPWISLAPLPEEQQDKLNRPLTIMFHYMSKLSFSIDVELKAKPSILVQYFKEVVEKQGIDCNLTDDFVLKVLGREEFLSGDYALPNFLWVRHCLKTNEKLHLSVISVTQLSDETARFMDWPLFDNSSGQFSCHDDLCLEGRDLDDIHMISLWDCNRNLRVKLLGFDIPNLPSECPQHVYVNASILYGDKVLSSVLSSSKAFADEVLWNEWLEFDILLRDLPRGAKLGLTINEVLPGSRDSKMSSTTKMPEGKVLYFVNLLLIDHRSALSQGPYSLHMWTFPYHENEGKAYEADKLSTATNPDITNSMAISFLLDRYNFPVVLPGGFSQSECSGSSVSGLNRPPSVLSRQTPRTLSKMESVSISDNCSPVESLLQKIKHPSPSTNRDCLGKFRENIIRYSMNLPHYLRNVKWSNRRAVDDIHWLLGNCTPADLDLTVALELLSIDFPDLTVRKLAVQRLEKLSNDDVLKYLLQLVQTLKVEPYHDSFLARFLIQRALKSKRIGHFFFWYVRSEVAGSLYFRQRMAVILEAYLLGCGQDMLDSFSQQVQAVESLQEVAVTIKRLFPEKTDLPPAAHVKLQELLRSCVLPNEFLLPFDPRIKAGRIILEKCKVMASKKKPLWLEFCPMPSPNLVTPVGIIFKEGDDLRQDMLVIQTLVLMDSIWQEKALDLSLIPYGCISTGHNVGMIEIVRNAVTIAAIQRSVGGTMGAFKNDALSEWLKSKCPLTEIHFQTSEKFVKSCAGYCVATYVLGVGDRHNDNIMITDKGNLFHIDFGHILGNTKRFLGWKRERVPFVLTPDFLFVMGRVKDRTSLQFQRFRDTCTEAYLSLRSHSHLLITLFTLMLLTGIPELSAAEDIRYLRQALQEEQSEAEAKEHFLQQIADCEKHGWTVQTNWWIHMMMGIK